MSCLRVTLVKVVAILTPYLSSLVINFPILFNRNVDIGVNCIVEGFSVTRHIQVIVAADEGGIDLLTVGVADN